VITRGAGQRAERVDSLVGTIAINDVSSDELRRVIKQISAAAPMRSVGAECTKQRTGRRWQGRATDDVSPSVLRHAERPARRAPFAGREYRRAVAGRGQVAALRNRTGRVAL